MHNFSFNLESGQLVAIMGGSGVGKSTLLSILNGNIIPGEGSVCLNGHPLSDPECKQLIGFVPQDDLLIEELTVFQNLWYTARLCFANLTEKEIEDRVNTILEDLDLSKIRDLAVGSPIRKTISGGPVSYTHLTIYVRRAEHLLLRSDIRILAPLLRLLVTAPLQGSARLYLHPRIGHLTLQIDTHHTGTLSVTAFHQQVIILSLIHIYPTACRQHLAFRLRYRCLSFRRQAVEEAIGGWTEEAERCPSILRPHAYPKRK